MKPSLQRKLTALIQILLVLATVILFFQWYALHHPAPSPSRTGVSP